MKKVVLQNNIDYERFYSDIAIHVEMMVTPELRKHAYASVEHDLSFQILRLLSGYHKALKEIKTAKVNALTELKTYIEDNRAPNYTRNDILNKIEEMMKEHE